MLATSTARTPNRADLSTLTILRLLEPVGIERVMHSIRAFGNDSLYSRFHIRDNGKSNLVQSFAAQPGKVPPQWWAGDVEPSLSTLHPVVGKVMKLSWNIETGPLVRFVLGVRGGAVHEVAVILHHLLGDGACQVRIMENIGSWLVGDCRDLDPGQYLGAVEDAVAAERSAERSDREHWSDRIESWCRRQGDAMRRPLPEPDPAVAEGGCRALLPLTQASGEPRAPRVGELLHDVYAALADCCVTGVLVWTAASTRPRGQPDPDFGYFVTMLPMLPPDPGAVEADPHWAEDVRRRFLPPVDMRQMLWDVGAQWSELYLTYRKSVAHNSVRPIGSGSAVFDLLQPYHEPLGQGSVRYAQVGTDIDLQADGDTGGRIFPRLVTRLQGRARG